MNFQTDCQMSYQHPTFSLHEGQDYNNAFVTIAPVKKRTSASILEISKAFSHGPLKIPHVTLQLQKEKLELSTKLLDESIHNTHLAMKVVNIEKTDLKKIEETESSMPESILRSRIKNKRSKRKSKKSKDSRVCFSAKTKKSAEPVKALRPASNEVNNAAAVQMQRIARGGWQRLKFRIRLLQHKLDTVDERKSKELRHIEDLLQQRKYTFHERLARKAWAPVDAVCQVTAEHKQLIAYLQKDNKRLRVKNQEIYRDIQQMKHENERLEEANAKTVEYMKTLKDHTVRVEETNEQLNELVPKYKSSVEIMENAINKRIEVGASELKTRLMYAQCIGEAVEVLDARCSDKELVDQVFELCLGLEDLDKAALEIS
jgi:hypothetical protein